MSDVLDDDDSDFENPSAYPPSIQAGIPKLGEIPKGWKRHRLGDLLRRVERPARLGDSETYQLVTAKRNRGGIVARETLRGEQIRTKTQFYVEAGDFLISNRQISHGACGVVPESLHRAVVSNEYTAFHTSDALDPAFLNALSHSVYFQQTCFHSSIGVHVEKLVFRLDDWMGWKFDIPPIEQQKRIVQALNSWDQSIGHSERLASLLRSTYQGKLNQFSVVVNAPTLRLDQIARINLKSLSARTSPDFEFDYFDIAAAEDGAEEEFSGRVTFKSAPSRARRQVLHEGVVYSTVRPLLRRLFIAGSRPDAVYSTGYSILEPSEACLVQYLKHILVSQRVERQIYARLTGSGYPAISENDLAEIRIPLPAIECQALISSELTEIEEQHNLYVQYAHALRTQRRGLMQKLLTGEWQLDARFDPPEAITKGES